ncbi:MAG TPA: DUF5715 family protein [Pyrinomonadaceae bacterium]|nr:DUF5715 family protein [Pyrinomonadaceae bacterium]
MANLKARYLLLIIFVTAAFAAGAWALTRFTHEGPSSVESSKAAAPPASDPDLWARSMEKVKEDRGGTGNVAIEIPAQLRHYDERRWFLATQVAAVKKFKLQPVQDFVDLAAMIQRGEIIPLPAVTDTYILFGVGARVDGDAFTRYVADQNLQLNDEAGLRAAYARVETEHAKLQKEISDLQAQLRSLKNDTDKKQDELENELSARLQELKSNEADQALISQYYGHPSGSPESGPKLWRDYDSLQALARDFGGRSFNLDDSSDRQTLKVYLLSSLRPQALKVLEEIAKRYHDNFARPLPVSSLIRPEQYQRALRRVNRYAVLIDTPPHSTGLAFDIDYRYLSNAEQNFVMKELARLKDEGRIEVIRERGANYHVFAFIDGHRPSDDLITASLDEVGPPAKQTNDDDEKAQSQQKSARVATKSRAARNSRRNAKATRITSKAKAKKRR